MFATDSSPRDASVLYDTGTGTGGKDTYLNITPLHGSSYVHMLPAAKSISALRVAPVFRRGAWWTSRGCTKTGKSQKWLC